MGILSKISPLIVGCLSLWHVNLNKINLYFTSDKLNAFFSMFLATYALSLFLSGIYIAITKKYIQDRAYAVILVISGLLLLFTEPVVRF